MYHTVLYSIMYRRYVLLGRTFPPRPHAHTRQPSTIKNEMGGAWRQETCAIQLFNIFKTTSSQSIHGVSIHAAYHAGKIDRAKNNMMPILRPYAEKEHADFNALMLRRLPMQHFPFAVVKQFYFDYRQTSTAFASQQTTIKRCCQAQENQVTMNRISSPVQVSRKLDTC